jgi:hypothetical protein
MIRSPAVRWHHAKTTRLRDCTIANKISTFIPEAWISGSQKSSETSQDEVFADHGSPPGHVAGGQCVLSFSGPYPKRFPIKKKPRERFYGYGLMRTVH